MAVVLSVVRDTSTYKTVLICAPPITMFSRVTAGDNDSVVGSPPFRKHICDIVLRCVSHQTENPVTNR